MPNGKAHNGTPLQVSIKQRSCEKRTPPKFVVGFTTGALRASFQELRRNVRGGNIHFLSVNELFTYGSIL